MKPLYRRVDNFAKYKSIFKILSLTKSATKYQMITSHLTLKTSLHYPVKP